jgi:hypothetical protein
MVCGARAAGDRGLRTVMTTEMIIKIKSRGEWIGALGPSELNFLLLIATVG